MLSRKCKFRLTNLQACPTNLCCGRVIVLASCLSQACSMLGKGDLAWFYQLRLTSVHQKWELCLAGGNVPGRGEHRTVLLSNLNFRILLPARGRARGGRNWWARTAVVRVARRPQPLQGPVPVACACASEAWGGWSPPPLPLGGGLQGDRRRLTRYFLVILILRHWDHLN